jgi:hypothetical protein
VNLDHSLPFCTSQHSWNDRHMPLCPAICPDGVSWTFFFATGWPQIMILLVPTSQVASITGLKAHFLFDLPVVLWSIQEGCSYVQLVRRKLTTGKFQSRDGNSDPILLIWVNNEF